MEVFLIFISIVIVFVVVFWLRLVFKFQKILEKQAEDSLNKRFNREKSFQEYKKENEKIRKEMQENFEKRVSILKKGG